MTVTGALHIAFGYAEKQMLDIEKFCCLERDSSVFAIDPTFNLCDMWVTDTSYKNKRLRNPLSGKHPVFFGPVMIHFTKYKATFRRFALELLSLISNLKVLKKIGADLELATFKGFKSIITLLSHLVCVQHVMQKDESRLPERTCRSAAEKNHASTKILKDIYGYKEGNYHKYGLTESVDCEDFSIKIESLKCRWQALCPEFHV